MQFATEIFLLVLAASLSLRVWLAYRQYRYVQRHRDAVPGAFSDRVSLAEHQRAADYTVVRTRTGVVELLYGGLLLLAWTLGGGLELLDTGWRGAELGPIITGTLFIFSVMLIGSLLDLPFDLYRTFGIEQRFGFNRTTLAIYLLDLVKQGVLSLLVGVPIVAIVLWLMVSQSSVWWLWAWAVWIAFNLLMIWIYPTLIAPMFNKFLPLDNATLKARIEALLARCGFQSDGVFVMDGSRRSSHGNAYFTGLGSHKRIVFFDTLLTSLNENEVEAVLAHELGHFKRHHIRKTFFVMAIFSLLGLWLLNWFMQQDALYTALGVSQPSAHVALILFFMIVPLIMTFLKPVFSWLSRKHEFEADEFAARASSAADLVRALVKMYRENASTLTPDPLYSAFHDSHPPAPVRIGRLSQASAIDIEERKPI